MSQSPPSAARSRRVGNTSALIVAALLCLGCKAGPSSLFAALPEQTISLSTDSWSDSETAYARLRLTVRGYGHYATDWYLTGTIGPYTLHGTYEGEPPPVSDFLWLSADSEFVAIVPVSISRSTADFVDVSIPLVVVAPGQPYTLRVRAMDGSIIQEFPGTLQGPV